MDDTPRTDEFYYEMESTFLADKPHHYVPREFAQQLERELNAASRAAASLAQEMADLQKEYDDLNEWASQYK